MARKATRKSASTRASSRRSHKSTVRRKTRSTERNTTARARTGRHRASTRRWSKHVTEHSDAMDLRHGVFKLDDPKKIAASLKRSAEESHRRKANPFRSALSMLTFYINRAGKNLSARRKHKLMQAKDELRELFGRA